MRDSGRKRGYVKHVEGKRRHKLIAKMGGAYCQQKNCEINQHVAPTTKPDAPRMRLDATASALPVTVK